MLDSIKKLREFSRWFDGIYATEEAGSVCMSHTIHNYPPVKGMGSVGDNMRSIADEIEREIEERYMLSPVDADGVPIHMGDSVEGKLLDDSTVSGTVRAFHLYDDELDSVYLNVNVQGGWTIKRLCLTQCRHVKPRTLEDVLREFTDEVIEWSGYSGPVSGDKTWGGMAGKYANEIRAMFGEGADE